MRLKNQRRPKPKTIPTPAEIDHAPELALFHALDEILELIPRVLVVAHPQLADPESPLWRHTPNNAESKARLLLNAAHQLQRHIRTYRKLIDDRRNQSHTTC